MTVGSLKLRFLFQVCSPSRDFGVWADGVYIHHQRDRAENDQQDKMIWTVGNRIAKIKAYEIILSMWQILKITKGWNSFQERSFKDEQDRKAETPNEGK